MGVVRGLKHEQSSSVALQTSNLTTSLNVWLICAISQWLSTKKMQHVLLGNTAIKVAQFSLLINLYFNVLHTFLFKLYIFIPVTSKWCKKKIVNFNSKIKKLLRIISSPPLLKDYFYLINLIYLTDTYMLIENKSIISFKRIKFYEWKNYHDIKIKLQYN